MTRPAPCTCCHSLNWMLHKLISFIKHILHLNLEKQTQERRTGLFLFHHRENYRQPSHHKVSAINETSFQISQINIQTSSTYCSCSLSSNLTVTNEKACDCQMCAVCGGKDTIQGHCEWWISQNYMIRSTNELIN